MDVSVRPKGVFAFGRFRLDPLRRNLTRDGMVVALSPRLFDTLLYMVENPDRVVEKDELLSAVWPGRFVEEGNVSQTIFALRKALNDAGEGDNFISTAPGRGYRFTAPVEWAAENLVREVSLADPSPDASSPVSGVQAALRPAPDSISARGGANAGRWSAWRSVAYLAPVLLGVTLVAVVLYRRGPPPPEKPNIVVLADFQNLTNDPALGTVLGKVLEIDLAQSPFLSLMSPQQESETLRLMERPEDARLTPALAQEVCARVQGRAVLSGAVGAVGSRYLVTLEARDCGTGKGIAQDKSEAGRKEDLPTVLDALTLHMREGLSESPASIQKFDVPIAQATTSSFKALKAFSLGEQARAVGDNAGAVPLFQRALELDPSFALADEELASAYLAHDDIELARTYYRKAFQLRDKVSEIERLHIASHYDQFVGDIGEAIHVYTVWAQTYPLDWIPVSNLANLYTDIARYPQAIVAGKNALRLNPGHANPYVVLARAYKRSNRFREAKAICRQAIARGLDGWSVHGLLYEIAFAENDRAVMAEQVAMEKDKPTFAFMLDYEAWAAATAGQVRQAKAFFAQAIASARLQGADHAGEVSEIFTDDIAMLAGFGVNDESRQTALQAPSLDVNDDAPLALARAGEVGHAAVLAAAFEKRNPGNTIVNDIDLPLIQATIALRQRRPDDAARLLQPALPFELRDFDVPSLLGQADLDMKAADKAAAEYRKILANRGVDATSPLYPLAYLGLARALHLEGRLHESGAAYAQFFAFWKDADQDLPVLQNAKREYAQLQASQHPERRSP
jgi:DNA-binding winged helix-turn-helix (wHTH) protein/tetratricopeptide (TPR) repeat protein